MTKEELARLEREIAIDHAVSIIKSEGVPCWLNVSGNWLRRGYDVKDSTSFESVSRAVRFLEKLDLLVRVPGPGVVVSFIRVLEEPVSNKDQREAKSLHVEACAKCEAELKVVLERETATIERMEKRLDGRENRIRELGRRERHFMEGLKGLIDGLEVGS